MMSSSQGMFSSRGADSSDWISATEDSAEDPPNHRAANKVQLSCSSPKGHLSVRGRPDNETRAVRPEERWHLNPLLLGGEQRGAVGGSRPSSLRTFSFVQRDSGEFCLG